MKNIHKNKSRTRLWDAMSGVNAITGVAGEPTISTIVFTDNPAEGETIVFTSGGVSTTFTFTATVTLEGHVLNTTNLTTTLDALIVAMLAHSVTGAWGYLYPDDSVALVNTGGTDLDITYWPGTWANSIVLTDTCDITGTPTFTGGLDVPELSTASKWNTIDTTGNAGPKIFYHLDDGIEVGDECNVLIKTAEASDTPTIIGHLVEGETAMVECLFPDAAGGLAVSLIWDGTNWLNVSENGTLTFTASA